MNIAIYIHSKKNRLKEVAGNQKSKILKCFAYFSYVRDHITITARETQIAIPIYMHTYIDI